MCRHFGEPLVMNDFVGRDNLATMYPRSNLKWLALVLSMHQPLKHVAFPQEWRDSLAFGSAPAQPHMRHKLPPEYGAGKDTPTRDHIKGTRRPCADPQKVLSHGMEGGEIARQSTLTGTTKTPKTHQCLLQSRPYCSLCWWTARCICATYTAMPRRAI